MTKKKAVVIPAAGIGSRFNADLPKQYATIFDRTVLEHTVLQFVDQDEFDVVCLVLSPNDIFFNQLNLLKSFSGYLSSGKLHIIYLGGETRAHSVLNGILYLIRKKLIHDDDWMIIHDVVRCCLPSDVLQNFMDSLLKTEIGSVLAIPVSDTVKLAESETNRIKHTVDRTGLWLAQTPQAFKTKILLDVLNQVTLNTLTDESSAIEKSGFHPLLVLGDKRNIKITTQDDLYYVEFLLKQKQELEK